MAREDAIQYLRSLIDHHDRRTRTVAIVNAHTLNLATVDAAYRNLINSSDMVFGDGTGVRWAARQRGVEMKANLVGTDLVPDLFDCTPGLGYRYFMLGTTENSIALAADFCRSRFPGWQLAGFHHGYIAQGELQCVLDKINTSKPHVLLVGMGNPLQETWIHSNRASLNVPVCIGIGGLLDHWAGNLKRAPVWARRLGIEWLQILLQQPHKWRRYLIGNVVFLARIRQHLSDDLSIDHSVR